MKQYRSENSREDAKYFAETVILRSAGKCEVCEMHCSWIGEAHHIAAVKHGGNGFPDNLVFLCPNCHSTIEKIRTRYCENAGFEQWIFSTYGADKAQRLMDLAYASTYRTWSRPQ